MFKFAQRSQLVTSFINEGSLSTNLKTKLQNFSDKTVHLTLCTHDHHMNVSKTVDLRKAINNKLLVSDVSSAVTLIATGDIAKPSPDTVETVRLKHLEPPADIHQITTPDTLYEREVSDTEIIEVNLTLLLFSVLESRESLPIWTVYLPVSTSL